jgi:hypothetical protein
MPALGLPIAPTWRPLMIPLPLNGVDILQRMGTGR